jgi:tetratricopeptide (TPR) repeat protein
MAKVLLFICLILTSVAGLCQVKNELSEVEQLVLDSRYEEAVKLIDSYLPRSTNATTLSIKKAEVFIRLGKLNDAELLLKQIEESVSKEKNPLYYKALLSMDYGSLYQNQGRNDLAIEQFQQAITYLEQDKRAANLETADALAYLGNVYRSTGKYVQAEEQLQRALAIRQAKLPENHELIAASYNDLGLVYTQLDVDKAFDYYEKALAI